jgi:hypothetical protein
VRIGLSIIVLLVTAVPALAGNPCRLRGTTPAESRLIADLLAGSAVARRLAAAIQESDVIVYVELTASVPRGRAATRLAATTSTGRYLRVALGLMTHPADRPALLAHELQHAVEIAGARDVRDAGGLRRLYARIGEDRRAQFAFETTAARRVAEEVRREMRDMPAIGPSDTPLDGPER